MLPVSAEILIILYLLRGTTCHDADSSNSDSISVNLTVEVRSIVECFTKAVDIPWQFSEEERHRVAYFEFVTFSLCERSIWRIFECNHILMDYLQKAQSLQNASIQEEYAYYETANLQNLENATNLQRQAMQVSEKLVLLIQTIKLMAKERNETRLLNDNCSRLFFDMETLENRSNLFAAQYLKIKTIYQLIYIRTYALWYYLPPFVIIIFICGMVGNGMLLLIFVRHPETRAGPNAMLVNLAICDTLFLFCNVALDYCKKLWGFPLGMNACYIYTFFLTLITGGSVYSMTVLSFSRYVAVTAIPGKTPNRLLTSMPVMLVSVWILSSIVAIPDTLSSQNLENRVYCGADNRLLNSICDFLFISFLPLAAITCFYISASKRLQKSARNIPGESVGQDKVRIARERGAMILPALAFVFAITYLPFYTLWAIITIFSINTNASPGSHRLFYMVYFLFNLNSTLNPIALYLASGMFRNYFNKYLNLGMMKRKTPAGTLTN